MANPAFNKKLETSEQLYKLSGKDRMSRPEAMRWIWSYIKKHDLQNATKRRIIEPDEGLSDILGSKPIDMLKMPAKLYSHLFE